jgi:hypothetical protein
VKDSTAELFKDIRAPSLPSEKYGGGTRSWKILRIYFSGSWDRSLLNQKALIVDQGFSSGMNSISYFGKTVR